MKTALIAVLACSAVLAGVSLAQPKSPKPAAPSPEDLKKHMQESEKTASPGPVHAALMKLAGSYAVKTRFWMDGSKTGQVMESAGEATFKPALDGRFLIHEETGSMAGQKLAAFKYWGYNNEAKAYEAFWSYTGSTALMQLSGTSADEGKTVNYTATFAGSDDKFQVVRRELSADSFVIELVSVSADGSKGPTMESTYTRKK